MKSVLAATLCPGHASVSLIVKRYFADQLQTPIAGVVDCQLRHQRIVRAKIDPDPCIRQDYCILPMRTMFLSGSNILQTQSLP
jgi:hypothetical protein